MFGNLSMSRDRHAISSPRARDRKRRPSLEALEGRQLMSLGAEMIGTVNTTTRNAQFDSDNATNFDGQTVVVWTDTFSTTDHDIRAQRFNPSGGKVGPEIVVSFSSLDESHPRVAIDGAGRFEVAWTQTLSNGDSNVVAQRFDANGVATGSLIQVANTSQQGVRPRHRRGPRRATSSSPTPSTSTAPSGLFYKEYNSGGTLLASTGVANTTVSEAHSSVAISAVRAGRRGVGADLQQHRP